LCVSSGKESVWLNKSEIRDEPVFATSTDYFINS